MLYPAHSLGESYPSAEIQLVYSTAPADWANLIVSRARNVKYSNWRLSKFVFVYLYPQKIIIIIMRYCQHGYPWPSLATSPYRSSPLAGLKGYIPPVSSHSCCMYVRAGRPAFGRPYVGVHRNTSLIISSLLLQQCPPCLVRLTWIVFVMGGRWPYSWCFVVCCLQALFNIARSILV